MSFCGLLGVQNSFCGLLLVNVILRIAKIDKDSFFGNAPKRVRSHSKSEWISVLKMI